MIDLGEELAGYSDDEPARPDRHELPERQYQPGGGWTLPLADLQAAGFDIRPDAPGPPTSTITLVAPDGTITCVGGGAGGSCQLPIVHHTDWRGGDDPIPDIKWPPDQLDL